jgi:hypothetical protein
MAAISLMQHLRETLDERERQIELDRASNFASVLQIAEFVPFVLVAFAHEIIELTKFSLTCEVNLTVPNSTTWSLSFQEDPDTQSTIEVRLENRALSRSNLRICFENFGRSIAVRDEINLCPVDRSEFTDLLARRYASCTGIKLPAEANDDESSPL